MRQWCKKIDIGSFLSDPFPLIVSHICDMIKRNESDVGDVVFKILAKTVVRFLCFVFGIDKSFITLEPDIQLQWGLHQNEALLSYETVV